MTCTRCDGTGLLNADFVPLSMWKQHRQGDLPLVDILRLLADDEPDVTVCDCCGDGESAWYGDPGAHYEGGDDAGRGGPYAYNGGLPECS